MTRLEEARERLAKATRALDEAAERAEVAEAERDEAADAVNAASRECYAAEDEELAVALGERQRELDILDPERAAKPEEEP